MVTKRETTCNASSTPVSFERFLGWSRRELGLFGLLRGVRDGRRHAHIPLPAVLLAMLAMFWLGWGSLRTLDDQLERSRGLRRALSAVGWGSGISDDTFREALARLDLGGLRVVLHHLCRHALLRWRTGRYRECELAQRLQPLHESRLCARAVVALDGHFLFGAVSERRRCSSCLDWKWRHGEHEMPVHGHVAVFAQWVGTHPAAILDIEPVRPHENELIAAYRLLPRLAEVYGQRLGIIIADAMYDGEPFRRMVAAYGYRSVVVFKDPFGDPGRTALRMLEASDPARAHPDWTFQADAGTTYRVWERPAGGRRLIEVRREDRRGSWKSQCLTDLPASEASAVAVGLLLEERWWIENTGFHELVGRWHLDRAYVHAHKPVAAWACVLLALVAYMVFQWFAYRVIPADSRPPRRSLTAVRWDLVATLERFGTRGLPRIRAPC